MEYIWETYIKKEYQVKFKQAEIFSPYYEIANSDYISRKDGIVEINGLYRFATIFQPLLDLKEMNASVREALYDLIAHLLANVDVYQGINHQEGRIRKIQKQIEQGEYGIKAKGLFHGLDDKRKYEIANAMLLQQKSGESVYLYAVVLTQLLNTGIVYKNKENKKELLFYAGQPKDKLMEEILELSKELFLPLGYEIRVFYENHFGLLGSSQSLHYERLELL